MQCNGLETRFLVRTRGCSSAHEIASTEMNNAVSASSNECGDTKLSTAHLAYTTLRPRAARDDALLAVYVPQIAFAFFAMPTALVRNERKREDARLVEPAS